MTEPPEATPPEHRTAGAQPSAEPSAAAAPAATTNEWKTLDRELKRVGFIEDATAFVARPLVAPGLALVFVALAGVTAAAASGLEPGVLIIIVAALVGAYMALNIGANDAANNMGAPVGAGAIGLGRALLLAAVFEVAGALIAGREVVETVSSDIIDPGMLAGPGQLAWVMLAALLAAALWLNIATWIGATVSTTHSIVGGIVGAGLVAGGTDAVQWDQIALITLSWIVAPLVGGVSAAMLLAFIKARVIYVEDRVAAARRWVPVLIAVMAGSFSTYLALILPPPFPLPFGQSEGQAGVLADLGVGMVMGLLFWAGSVPLIGRMAVGLDNRKRSLRRLFGYPLVAAAALMSFAHGANDVSNVVGPLAAIVRAVQMEGGAALPDGAAAIPWWVMLTGASGISVGLLLFGPKLIRLVGSEITKLNPLRAYCVAVAVAITVIFASWMGLPVSTTHISVGAIFGVGLYREWHSRRHSHLHGQGVAGVVPPEERSRRRLVRRSHMLTLATAWVVTVPVSAGLSALLFWFLYGLSQ